jgi:hypothetical protein
VIKKFPEHGRGSVNATVIGALEIYQVAELCGGKDT